MRETESLEIRTCPTETVHETTVSVPVQIMPYANPGTVTVCCLGSPDILPGVTPAGTVGGSCSFTVSQTMRVSIPIVFGASVLMGETYTECGGTAAAGGDTPSDEDCDCEPFEDE